MKKILLSPRFILPFAVFVGVLLMGLHAADLWRTVESGKLAQPAMAQDASASSASSAASSSAPPAASPSAPSSSSAASADSTLSSAVDSGVNLVPPPSDDSSDGDMKVLKQLAERRAELDKRANELDMRAQLLKVAEQRVNQKIKEMETLRKQLQSMVDQVNGAQQAQVGNLVKIYETMKPSDAARIFAKLDMPVLLGVIRQMKPKSTAPILAAMDPNKAKEITDALTSQDKLPQPQ
ncbi:MAG: MotE family protein [Alphaproteobacteria bacterium]|nr:MotE family protein [Alphaproteobacteria bacterium]